MRKLTRPSVVELPEHFRVGHAPRTGLDQRLFDLTPFRWLYKCPDLLRGKKIIAIMLL